VKNPLLQLQDDVTTYLLGNPTTAAVSYSSFRKQVIEATVDEALAAWKVRVPGKIGVTGLIMMPKARNQDPNVPGPQLQLEITIRTFEDPKVNNTTYSAEDVAIENLRWLDGLLIGNVTQLYAPHDEDAVKPNYDYPGFLVYDTVLKGACPQDYLGRTPTPVLVDNGDQTFTITCADPAAVVFYRVDGEMPMLGSQDQQYDGSAIPAVMGNVICYQAWNPLLLPSDVPRAIVEVPPGN
jgi:hypothetical protein